MRRLAPDGMAARALLSLLATAGFYYVNIMPAVVQGLVDALGFSQRQAGLVASANLYGASAGALLAVMLVRRVPWRGAARLLLVLLILCDAASVLVATPPGLVAMRALHGLAAGTLVGISYGVMARTREPDRSFGVLLFVQFGLGGLGILLLPGLVAEHGIGLLFGVLVALSALVLALLPMLADYSPPAPVAGGAPAAGSGPLRASWPLWLTLGAIFLFQAGNMALFPYVIGLGEAAGLGRGFIELTLACASWIGLAGSALVVWLSTRRGRLWPLAFAIALTVAGNALLLWSRVPALFVLANLGVGVTWAMVIPWLLGMCAALDPHGRVAALGGLASKLGLASGPLAAALLLGGADYARVIGLSVVVLVLCMALALAPAAKLDRDAAAS